MNVVILGATGMVEQGVLSEALLDPAVTRGITVGRTRTGKQHAKLREIAHADLYDLYDLSPIAGELTGLDGARRVLVLPGGFGGGDEQGGLSARHVRPDALGRADAPVAG